MKLLLQIAVLMFGGVVAAVVAGEITLRLLTAPTFEQRPFEGFEWLVYDPIVAWTNRADFDSTDITIAGFHFPGHIRINALGFRGAAVRRKKPAGTLRIVCLGDSGTFGIWLEFGKWLTRNSRVRFDNAYPGKLAELLHAKHGARVEVINAGVIGYSSSHGLRQLMTEILDLEPDILTVRFGYNDHDAAWNPALRAAEPSPLLARFLVYDLHDWRLVRLGFSVYEQWPALHPAPGSVPWASLEEFTGNLRRFAQVARRRSIHLLFLDYPLRPPESGMTPDESAFHRFLAGVRSVRELRRRHRLYQQALRRTAEREHVPVLLTQPALRQSSKAFSAYDMVHPSRAGARLIAQLVSRKLAALGWL